MSDSEQDSLRKRRAAPRNAASAETSQAAAHGKTQRSAREAVLFTLSGCIGTAFFYLMYMGLLKGIPESFPRRITVCWSTAYMFSVAWQHSLHRWIVFGTDAPYWPTLLKSYVTYSLSMALSTLLTDTLVYNVGVGETAAWVTSILATGVLNYYTVASTLAS